MQDYRAGAYSQKPKERARAFTEPISSLGTYAALGLDRPLFPTRVVAGAY